MLCGNKKPHQDSLQVACGEQEFVCHHDCWLNRISETVSLVETITFGELNFLWNFQKLIFSEMLVGIYLSRITWPCCYLHLHLGAYF